MKVTKGNYYRVSPPKRRNEQNTIEIIIFQMTVTTPITIIIETANQVFFNSEILLGTLKVFNLQISKIIIHNTGCLKQLKVFQSPCITKDPLIDQADAALGQIHVNSSSSSSVASPPPPGQNEHENLYNRKFYRATCNRIVCFLSIYLLCTGPSLAYVHVTGSVRKRDRRSA